LRVEEVVPDLDPIIRHVADSGESQFDEEIEIKAGSRSRYINRIVSPVRGRFSGTTQSITVLVQDVTDQVMEERVGREREGRRRRHAECLARIGLETVTIEPSMENLDEPARRIAEAIGGSAMIYLYARGSGELRVTVDRVETEGVRRAIASASKADIVLLLLLLLLLHARLTSRSGPESSLHIPEERVRNLLRAVAL
jgi:hypothetical protein